MTPNDIIIALQAKQESLEEILALLPVASKTTEDTDPAERLRALSRIGLIVTKAVAKG